MIIVPANTLAAGGFEVANSCRLDGGDGAYMHKTFGTPTSTKICTISWWMKQSAISGQGDAPIFSARTDSNNRHVIYWDESGGLMKIWGKTGGSVNFTLSTTQTFRDPSAWQHHIVAIDTNQGVATNRVKYYVNGAQVTSFSETTYPGEDALLEFSKASSVAYVGGYATSGGVSAFAGAHYLAEFVFIDGQQLTPTSFGEYDEDSPTIWKPIDVSGLTFGNNGFYLDFEDSANLGNDANGGTDLTEVNLDATDQATDTPTNNFCVMNPLDNYYQEANFTQGNNMVELTQPGGNHGYCSSTFGVAAGLWYFEAKPTTGDSRAVGYVDILQPDSSENMGQGGTGSTFSFRQTGQTKQGGSSSSYGSAYSTNDIIGVYLDLTANKAYFSINGTLQNSGTGLSITAIASTTTGFYKPGADSTNGSDTTWQFNFGGCPAFAISSGNTDDNGYGNFEYSPNITGDGSAKKFYSLCTKNLAEYG